MSCNIVSDKEIDFILSAFLISSKSDCVYFGDEYLKVKSGNYYFDKAHRANVNKIGQALKNKNYESYNTRYRENHEYEPYELIEVYGDKNRTLQALALLDYYDYQTCEAEGYDKSHEAAFINRVRKVLINALPGFSECSWGLN